jgi:transposase-like protein
MSAHYDPEEIRSGLRDDVFDATRQALAVLQHALAGNKFANDEQRRACAAAFARALIAPRNEQRLSGADAYWRARVVPEQAAQARRRMGRLRDRMYAGREIQDKFRREGPVADAYETAEEAYDYGEKLWNEQHPQGLDEPLQPEDGCDDGVDGAADLAQTAAAAAPAAAISHRFPKLHSCNEFAAGDLAQPAARRRAAIELLAAGKSIAAVAAIVGVSRRSIYNWRQDARVAERLARRSDELWSTVAQQLRGMVHPSLAVINEHLEDPHDKSRFRAATAVLRLPVLRKVIEAAIVGDGNGGGAEEKP